MDQNTLDEVKKIIKEINEYNSGKLECASTVENSIDDMKNISHYYKKIYLTYLALIKMDEISFKIYNRKSSSADLFYKLIDECYELLYAYKNYMIILKKYVKYILKSKDYTDLALAYDYSVKVQSILEIINEFFDTINSISTSDLFEYRVSDNYISNNEKGIIEIDEMSIKLMRENKRSNRLK